MTEINKIKLVEICRKDISFEAAIDVCYQRDFKKFNQGYIRP